MLRVVMFVIVGAMTVGIGLLMGSDPSVLPWMFVLGGLGAVAAVDLQTVRRR